jgi:DNA processing protein
MEEFTIPKSLLEIPHPPKKLYIRGSFPVCDKYLCIVGGRSYSEYGKRACESLIKGLSGQSICIVSGLALGIDTIAHEAALVSGLPTIAFPGSGLSDRAIYPAFHQKIAHRIIEYRGCLISEFEPEMRAQIWSFPQRNRLMAGISQAVLVIESKMKSGTLITAKLALDYNKTVLAVPGSIFSPYSEGPHFLIHQGAIPVRNSNDILEALGLAKNESLTSKNDIIENIKENCSENEISIINALEMPLSRDELIRKTNMAIHHLNISISLLELKGIIEEKFGKIYLSI